MRACLAWLALVVAHLPAEAQQRYDAAPITEAFAAWLEKNEAKGSLVVLQDGAPIARIEAGFSASEPFETASLSKAITAVCAATLVEDGVLSWDMTFDTIYGRGPAVALGDLVTHSGGLAPDGTQWGLPFWLDTPEPRSDDALELIFMRKGQSGTPGEHFYNNENYALLGLAIEAATGEDYESHCRKAALDPAGADGMASPRMGGSLPFAGWFMTLEDYGRFAHYWFGPESAVGRAPGDYPLFDEGDIYYGLGMQIILREESSRMAWYWHQGSVCFPRRLDAESLVMGGPAGLTVVIAHDDCGTWETVYDLQTLMFEAVGKVAQAE